MTTKANSASSKVTSVTIMGINVLIDANAVNEIGKDYWFLDDYTSDDPTAQFRAFVRLLKAALGESYRDVLKKLQGDDAVLAVDKVSDFASEVFRASSNLKN